ncbi:MAG: 4-vinyl reductase [Thermoplasmata archaeon]|nr:4-vinyl reductase [Thermoplasmata archaeon]
MIEQFEEAEKRILREALRLGYEVGFSGLDESAGWIRARYTRLVSEALPLGIAQNVIEKYKAGKEFGKRNRLFSSLPSDSGILNHKGKIQGIATPTTIVESSLPKGVSVARVPVKDAIQAVANMIRLAQGSEILMDRVSTVISNVADIHDRLAELKPDEGDRASVLTEGLTILSDIGWLESYDIVDIDVEHRSVRIDAVSQIARAVGTSSEPVCRPICIALESIGNKLFNQPVIVAERSCISQGDEKCRFIFFPRPQSD